MVLPLGILRDALAEERAEYLGICFREFTGKTSDDDAGQLRASLSILELTERDFERDVEGIGKVAVALADSEYAAEKQETFGSDFNEARRRMYQADNDRKHWQRRVNELMRLGSRSNETAKTIHRLKTEFPHLFDDNGKPVAMLDPITKRCKARRQEKADADEQAAEASLTAELNTILKRFGLKPIK